MWIKWVLLLTLPLLCMAFTADDSAKTISTDGTYSDTTNAIAYVRAKGQHDWVITVGSSGASYNWGPGAVDINVTNRTVFRGATGGVRPTITFTNAGIGFGMTATSSSNNLLTVSNFIFTTGATFPSTGVLLVDGVGVCFRYSGIRWTNLDSACWAGWIGSINATAGGGPYGVVDNCEFKTTGSSFPGFFVRDNGHGMGWTRPMSWGTTNAVYIEGCTYNAATPTAGRGLVDGNDACRVVVRNCNITNYTIVVHGPDSSGKTNSSLQLEVYGNNFYTDDFVNGLAYAVYVRGGTAAIYSNNISNIGGHGAVYNNAWRLTVDCASTGTWVSEGCCAQALYPGNYPLSQQVGTGNGTSLTASLCNGSGYSSVANCASEMICAWSNTVPATAFGEWGAGIDSGDAPFIVAGREYTNGVKLAYAPLVYPHPLVSLVAPSGDATSGMISILQGPFILRGPGKL